jgi:hypothetical protein
MCKRTKMVHLQRGCTSQTQRGGGHQGHQGHQSHQAIKAIKAIKDIKDIRQASRPGITTRCARLAFRPVTDIVYPARSSVIELSPSGVRAWRPDIANEDHDQEN